MKLIIAFILFLCILASSCTSTYKNEVSPITTSSSATYFKLEIHDNDSTVATTKIISIQ